MLDRSRTEVIEVDRGLIREQPVARWRDRGRSEEIAALDPLVTGFRRWRKYELGVGGGCRSSEREKEAERESMFDKEWGDWRR